MILAVDLGTTNLKAAIISSDLEVIASEKTTVSQGTLHRQDPSKWRTALKDSMLALTQEFNSSDLCAISISSTSGTIVPINEGGKPLSQAVMYNVTHDTFNDFSTHDDDRYFRATFSLPKIYWFKEKCQEVYHSAHKFLNPTDFLIGVLSGEYNRTDPTNGYKMGYHPENGWNLNLLDQLGIDIEKLPNNVVERAPIGEVQYKIRQELDLPKLPIYNGTVDSVASFIATNTGEEGVWSSSLGSSLSIKGQVNDLPSSEQFYAYPHPEKGYVCGGHSGVGTRWMVEDYTEGFVDRQLERFKSITTNLIAYPRSGSEVLPVEREFIPKFITGNPSSEVESFEAKLKTLLFFERWAYEMLEDEGYTVRSVSSTGYLSEFGNINQLRASILDRNVYVLDQSYLSTAVGAAAVAMYRSGLMSSLSDFPTRDQFTVYKPSPDLVDERLYSDFVEFFSEDAYKEYD